MWIAIFEMCRCVLAFNWKGAGPTFVTLFARSLEEGTLFGGINSLGRATLAMSIGNETTFLGDIVDININTREENSLQFDVEADAMSLRVWPTASPRPVLPTLTAAIPANFPIDSGTVGFFYSPGSSTSVSFDFFEAIPIPEPTSLAFAALAVAAMVNYRCRML